MTTIIQKSKHYRDGLLEKACGVIKENPHATIPEVQKEIKCSITIARWAYMIARRRGGDVVERKNRETRKH